MSLVSGYPQSYHTTGPIAAAAHDFYPYHSQGAAATGRFAAETTPGAGPATPESSAATSPYYAAGWMLGHHHHHPHPHHHPHQSSSPHAAELPHGMGHHGGVGDNGGPVHPAAAGTYFSGLPGAGGEYGAMPMFSMLDGSGAFRMRPVKKKNTANKKERRRTISINSAFSNLRGCIPNVPSDTKLSKIKTLRLATSYIAYLMDVLNKDDPVLTENGFKAELTKKIESREERRKREAEEILKAANKDKKSKGRTGWPQQVWANELKQE